MAKIWYNPSFFLSFLLLPPLLALNLPFVVLMLRDLYFILDRIHQHDHDNINGDTSLYHHHSLRKEVNTLSPLSSSLYLFPLFPLSLPPLPSPPSDLSVLHLF